MRSTVNPVLFSLVASLVLQACGGGSSSESAAQASAPTAAPAAALQVSAQHLQFADTEVGANSPAQTIALSNTGNAPLEVAGISVDGTNAQTFHVSNGCGTSLAAGASCVLSLTFSPSASGASAATLQLQTNPSGTMVVTLSGKGLAPILSVGSASIDFDPQMIGTTSSSQTLSIVNSGSAPLAILGMSLAGAQASMFSQASGCPASIPPGAGCPVSVSFQPSSDGSASATLSIQGSAQTSANVALRGAALNFPPYGTADPRVLVDIGVAALRPRNTWTTLPAGFTLGQVAGLTAGTVSDAAGFTPNSGGFIENSAAFPGVGSEQGTIYMRLQRAGIAIDDSTDAGATFFDSTGNTTGGWGADTATAFTLYDGANNILQWTMGPQATGIAILNAGSWLTPGSRYANSHGSPNLDSTYADIIFTWQGTTYWAYLDGTPVAYGSLSTPMPASGQFTQIVIGGYLSGAGNSGKPLGPFSIQRFQVSTAFSPPPMLAGRPLIGIYGDSFVVQGAGVTGNVPGPPGSPTIAQVDGVQAQMDPKTSPNATTGFIGQDGFTSRAQAYALKRFGGYLQFYTAAESGHGWAYTGMGGTTIGNTPAIDDFSLGKTGYSDALNAARPAYLFAFGSVNDVNNGVPANIVGDVQAHFDYWANNNPNLKGIYYIETLSWELATGACGARGGPAGWVAEMARQRGLLRGAFGSGYLAGTRKVPVTYVKTYETWVQGPNSARFLIASNPDNHTASANTGSSPNGHPDDEGNLQMVDAYLWPYLTTLLRH